MRYPLDWTIFLYYAAFWLFSIVSATIWGFANFGGNHGKAGETAGVRPQEDGNLWKESNIYEKVTRNGAGSGHDSVSGRQRQRLKDDKSISDDYAESVAVLNGMGVFKGYEDGSFKPEGNITRAEVATIIYRIDTQMFFFSWFLQPFSWIPAYIVCSVFLLT